MNCLCHGSYKSTFGRAFSESSPLSSVLYASDINIPTPDQKGTNTAKPLWSHPPFGGADSGIWSMDTRIRRNHGENTPSHDDAEEFYRKAVAAPDQPSRRAITPAKMLSAAALRHAVIFSPSTNTEMAMANRIDVSRSDATEAIGALVMAHITMP